MAAGDMDRTFMAVHSRGSMTPANLPSFVSRVAPDFRRLSAALETVGVLQAITTHSDTAEHDKFEHGERPRGEFVLGEDLVREVGERSFPTLLQW